MLSITKTRHLYQVRHDKIGCVFQSHDRKQCERYMKKPHFYTSDMDCRYISRNAKAHTIIRL